ncbi:uncharacterized protein LOC122319538 [Drosophila yakuba]|uniref:uncharacterized protein LOC122319538 n=1 Tax=Drosophila yakuba TaxID=7245 RepID=UPI001C8A0E4E|nr:uncharacterized protein LOC122319538 [Drosophila yakuba]
MPIGDDKKKLSADKPRSIFPPQGPKSPRIPSISVKTPAQISDDCATPSKATVQRTAKNMAASDLALAKFISVYDRLSEFEAQINTPESAVPTDTMLSVRRDQVRILWDKIEKEFDICSECLVSAGEAAAGIMPILRAKYSYCYSVYERCVAQLDDKIEQGTSQSIPAANAAPQAYISSGCLLPPCDGEVFAGDYLRWPTFRDLFTAIYINNPRLTLVEMLFRLNAKASGDAHAIVSISPITNEGFRSAWENLIERFENKRLLVNSQLKILFNVQSIPQKSGAALKVLQSTVQGCLTALELSGINTENWDCLLVYLCSSKLPKITLSLWEQSLHKKADIPTWAELNTFLTERHRTLEVIDDVRPSVTSQSHSKAMNSSGPSRKLNSYETKVAPKSKSCDLCNKENHPVRVWHSRIFALAQFLRNEQRLKRDEALKARYDSVIQE